MHATTGTRDQALWYRPLWVYATAGTEEQANTWPADSNPVGFNGSLAGIENSIV